MGEKAGVGYTGNEEQKLLMAGLQLDLNELEARLETWKGDDCHQYYAEDGVSPDACKDVLRLIAERDRAKKNLEREQATVADMQERARKAGFNSKAYDPD